MELNHNSGRVQVYGAILIWGSLLALGVFTIQILRSPLYFPVKTVRVEGPFQEVRPEEIEKVLSNEFSAGFFSLSLSRIEKLLLALPWVQDVTISREWPARMKIVVHEKQAVACWGTDAFLTSEGRVFLPPVVHQRLGLPVLKGPIGQENIVWTHFQAMNRALKPLRLELKSLTLSGRHSWIGVLQTGQTLYFGKNRLFSRLARFRILYEKDLHEKVASVSYVDLRYSNGMAVGWKQGESA